VDRTRVRPDAGQRLAESFETALRLSNGLARLTFLDEPTREELVFSSKHACPVCGYSVPTLEPKTVLVQQSGRSLPGLRWPGNQGILRSNRVVVNPDLSLASGAVRGWDRRNAHYSN